MRFVMTIIKTTVPFSQILKTNILRTSLFSLSMANVGDTITTTTKLRAALIDLSGTIHIEDQLLPGALEGVKHLRENGFLLRFVTNTTKESRYSLMNRLHKLGFDIEEREMLTSLTAAKMKVEKDKLRPLFFLEDSALEEFSDVPI